MSTAAVVMMVIAILVIWGGLALAALNLAKRSPDLGPAEELHRDL